MKYGIPAKTAVLIFALSITALAIRYEIPGWESHLIAADQWDDELTPETDQRPKVAAGARLREGTRLPPSVGRFFRSGRRWVFEQETTESERNRAVLPAADAVPPGQTPYPAAQADSAGADSRPADSPQADSPQARAAQQTAVQLRVLENLALQRIVDAIAQDASDVRWTVTGEVTEFAGENWLLLAAVFRAPSSQDNAQQPAPAAPALVTSPGAEDRASLQRPSTSARKFPR